MLRKLIQKLLTGDEKLVTNGKSTLLLLDFWRWSGSELMDNTQRGVLAEFLVASALGVHKTPREVWRKVDLEVKMHGRKIRIEVKSSAERQSWEGEASSFHQFDIRKTEGSEGKISVKRRWADIYVFCILKNRYSSAQTDALDTDKWEFLVLPTQTLDSELADQKSIRQDPLLKIGAISTNYLDLGSTIEDTAASLY